MTKTKLIAICLLACVLMQAAAAYTIDVFAVDDNFELQWRGYAVVKNNQLVMDMPEGLNATMLLFVHDNRLIGYMGVNQK
jgi:hypothetical protein